MVFCYPGYVISESVSRNFGKNHKVVEHTHGVPTAVEYAGKTPLAQSCVKVWYLMHYSYMRCSEVTTGANLARDADCTW
jgi:hypothetical protein